MDNLVIEARDVWRRYGGRGGFDAVRGVNLEISRGELFGLLGTNGAGKTSLLEVLEGLAPATQGSVKVLGFDPISQRSQIRPHTGVMLQEAGFPGDLTVLELARVWAGTLPKAQDVGQVLDSVGLSARAKVAISALSGGERRRLDLALALLGDPQVLFLDEPTTGLDPESRRNTWRLIEDLHAQGVTMILTTHYLEEAEQLATRLAIMDAGLIVQEGTVAQIAQSVPGVITAMVGAEPADLPALAGEVATQRRGGGVELVIRTFHLQADLHQLLNWASAGGHTLAGLDARSASLEQAFLTYTAGDR